MGDWLFGCDVCQEVCPWNHRAPLAEEPALAPHGGMTTIDLAELFTLDEAAFRARFRHTPLWRPKRRGLLRNAAIVLGNQRAIEALPALVRGLNEHDPLVRGAAPGPWDASTTLGATALSERQVCETDDEVRAEITLALAGSS